MLTLRREAMMRRMKLLRDVAIRHLVTVGPDASLRSAAGAMTDRNVGCAIVVENEDVCGIITERDLLRAISGGHRMDESKVREHMTPDVVSGQPGWEVLKAIKTMNDGGFRHLLVMDLDGPVGVVSLKDLMAAVVELVES